MLLDTHSLLWVLDGGASFGPRARDLIVHAPEVRFSSISIAEIRIKQMLGRLEVPDDLMARIDQARLRAAAYGSDAAEHLLCWPSLVRHDPFDRLLLTHAVALGTQLLTADRVLLDLPEAPVLNARS